MSHPNWHGGRRPDTLVRHLMDLASMQVAGAIREQVAGFTCPPVSASEPLATLERLDLAEVVTGLRRLMEV